MKVTKFTLVVPSFATVKLNIGLIWPDQICSGLDQKLEVCEVHAR